MGPLTPSRLHPLAWHRRSPFLLPEVYLETLLTLNFLNYLNYNIQNYGRKPITTRQARGGKAPDRRGWWWLFNRSSEGSLCWIRIKPIHIPPESSESMQGWFISPWLRRQPGPGLAQRIARKRHTRASSRIERVISMWLIIIRLIILNKRNIYYRYQWRAWGCLTLGSRPSSSSLFLLSATLRCFLKQGKSIERI